MRKAINFFSFLKRRIHLITFLLPVIVSTGVNAEHVITNLEPLQVEGQREAFVNPGLAADLREVALTPGGTMLINSDTLYERNTSSLAGMLRYIPGVWSSSKNGDDDVFFSSRGSNLDATDFDGNGVKLLQDGLSVTTADGNNHNRFIDPLASRYATFARGANGMKYGASTLGGAINFVSPTAYDSPEAQFFLNSGSHNQFLGRATVSKVFNEQFDGLLTLEGKQRDGYRDHNEQDRVGVYANGGWQLSDSFGTRFYTTYVKNDQELPSGLSRAQVDANPDQARPSAMTGNFQRNVETWRVANKSTWLIDEERRLDFGFSIEQQTLFHPIVDRNTFFAGLLINTDHQDVSTMARYQHKINNHDFLFGFNFGVGEVDGGHYGNAGGVRNGLNTIIDQDSATLEAYAMDRWQIDHHWTLVPAVQFVNATRELSNKTVSTGAMQTPEGDYFAINPSLGAIYQFRSNIELYANVSRLFEPPTNFELEDNVSGGSAVLKAMEGTVVETGTRGTQSLGHTSNWGWDLSLYYAWINDEILSVDDPAKPGTSLSTNIDNTIHAGIEMSVNASLAVDDKAMHTINPLVSLSINKFEFDNDATYGDNQLPAAPGYVLRGEVLYKNSNGFYAGPTFDVVDDRFADFTNSYEVDSYALMGLLAGLSKEKWNVYVEVENLLNEDYISRHNVKDSAAVTDEILNPGAPLSVYAGIRFQF